jgi:endoglucanase
MNMLFRNIIAVLAFSIVFAFAGPVSYYGELKASGKYIVGSKTGNTPVQVRGVSLGWSNTTWESARFFNAATVNAMVDEWKAEVIRVPYGYNEYGGASPSARGSDPAGNMSKVKTAIDAAIAKDVYVIIDWHSHSAENATETTAATAFFSEMAQTYGSNDHVIFEIYNEPLRVSWPDVIKPYANTIIDEIRKHSDNLILVGTPNWAQDIDVVANDAISGTNRENIAYVLHFYAASHALTSNTSGTRKTFKNAANEALDAGLPIFVSEYGTTHSDGGCSSELNSSGCRTDHYTSHNAANTDAWREFMDENKISSCAWSVNDKYEGSAFFGTVLRGTFQQSPANFSNRDMMTESGKYIYDKLNAYAENAVWRNSSAISFKPLAENRVFAANNAINMQVSGSAELQIFNLKGNLLYRQDFASGAWSVGLSDLPKGLYVAKIRLGNRMEILRIPIK